MFLQVAVGLANLLVPLSNHLFEVAILGALMESLRGVRGGQRESQMLSTGRGPSLINLCPVAPLCVLHNRGII